MNVRQPALVAAGTIVVVALLAVGCVPGATGSGGPSPTTSPGPSTSPPASASPPPSASTLSQPALKAALLVEFGGLVYCDPDEYPVGVADVASRAQERLPEIRADRATWSAITTYLGLDPTIAPPPAATLAIYTVWKQLRALELTPADGGFGFDEIFQKTDAADRPIERVSGTIASDGTITVASRSPSGPPPCPICLARGTAIATPSGAIAVEALTVGDVIWTLDGHDRRVPGVVLAVASTPVPPDHRVVDLVLSDGRTVTASPGHPLPDGRRLGDLRPGDRVDGAVVAQADLVPYAGGRTYDLRVSGPTGVYLAGDGIPLASTLTS